MDFLLSSEDQVLQLVALEMNSQLCLETCSVFESMGRVVGAHVGKVACPLVETMLRRTQRHLMEGKHVLVIGAGGVSKKFVWEAARDYGLKVRCGNRIFAAPHRLQDGLARAAPPPQPLSKLHKLCGQPLNPERGWGNQRPLPIKRGSPFHLCQWRLLVFLAHVMFHSCLARLAVLSR